MSKHIRRMYSKVVVGAPLLLMACGHMKGNAEELTLIQRGWEGDTPSEEGTPSALANTCAAKNGTGTYKGYSCDSSHRFITTKNITRQAALDNCKLNAQNNPTLSFYCTWNGKEIYRKELKAGICRGVGAR